MPSGPKNPNPRLQLGMLAAGWQMAKHEAAELTKREKDANKRISAMVEELGEPDDKGHIWVQGISFPGWEKDKPVVFNALQRQRRVSVLMDEEEAARILEKKGILDACSVSYVQVTDPEKAIKALQEAGLLDNNGFEVVTQISEDKVRDAYFDEKIDEEDYAEIFTEKVTWALLPGRL